MLFWICRLLLWYMNGHMMPCAVICWIWREINMFMRYSTILFSPSKLLWLVFTFLSWTQIYCILKVPSKTGGPPERKEVLLDDHDPIWLELRHAHIADVCPSFTIWCRLYSLLFRVISSIYNLSNMILWVLMALPMPG